MSEVLCEVTIPVESSEHTSREEHVEREYTVVNGFNLKAIKKIRNMKFGNISEFHSKKTKS